MTKAHMLRRLHGPRKAIRPIVAPVLAALALALSVAPPGAHAQVPRPAPPPAAPVKAETLPAVAISGATIHTGTGEVIDNGVIVIEAGKIRDVGKAITPPAGAQVIAANGSIITPGLTDALTSIGLMEVSLEPSTRDDAQASKDFIRAGFRAADGYNPMSSVIFVTRAEGVTSAGVIPSGGLISGQSAWADLDGVSAQDALAKAPLALHVHLDEGCEGGGACHATALLKVREAFDDARTFARTRAAWERNQSRPFAPSRLDLEALSGALDGKLPVVFHVNRAADILAALSLAKELNLKPVIAGGAEAWREAKTLAAQKVPVILFPLASDPDSFDSLGAREDNAAILHAAGVKIVISTGDTHNARKLRQVAGNAVRAGLPHAAAIAAITAAPAQAFGIDDRYGTLAKGKTANLVVWSADPLEIGTQVQHVFIRGRKVSLENRQTALLAKYRTLPSAGTRPAP